MGNARRLACFVCLFACLFYLVPQLSFAAKRIPVVKPATASDEFVKGVGTANESTLDINRHWGEVIDVEPQRINVPVTNTRRFKWPTFKNIVKSGLRGNLASLVATSAVTYLIAQIPDAKWDGYQLTRKSPPTPSPLDTNGWATNSNPQFKATSGLDAATAFAKSSAFCPSGWATDCKTVSCSYVSQTKTSCIVSRYVIGNGTPYYTQQVPVEANRYGTCVAPYSYDSATGLCSTPGVYGPFGDADWDQLVSGLDSLSPAQISELGPKIGTIPGSFDYPDSEIFSGPDTIQGQPTTSTTQSTNPDGSVSTSLSESTPTYHIEYNTNPLSLDLSTTTVTNNYSNGTLTSTTTTTNNSPSASKPSDEKQKVDCELVPTLCKWSEWTKEEDLPDKEELPTQEVEKPSAVSVGPGGACPAPVNIDVSMGAAHSSFEWSYQPTCDLMSMLSPIVRGCGFLVAAFILIARRK
ncbi:virulence factor TspB C-terminal domain-related protein [Pseudomonas knackmussii]|uniref:virulence factor TspB C-terminal domain-related protein n=1 Tax=Pseudomonas knackmussii TaxID=65741 RepID=UPI003BD4B447